MKTIVLLIASFFIVVLQSCGPTNAEIQARERAYKAHLDSLGSVAQQLDLEAQEMASMKALTIAHLEAAQVDLDRVKGWQFGRTRSERQQQIVNASLQVQLLQEQLIEIERSKTQIEQRQQVVNWEMARMQ